jgi:hypothetical protein
MNAFDKFCAVPAFALGVVFLVLGVPGLFAGCKANFTLPPVLEVLPAIVGWGIVRSVVLAWRRPKHSPGEPGPTASDLENAKGDVPRE